MNTIQYIKIRARIAAVSINQYAFWADQHVYCMPHGNSYIEVCKTTGRGLSSTTCF